MLPQQDYLVPEGLFGALLGVCELLLPLVPDEEVPEPDVPAEPVPEEPVEPEVAPEPAVPDLLESAPRSHPARAKARAAARIMTSFIEPPCDGQPNESKRRSRSLRGMALATGFLPAPMRPGPTVRSADGAAPRHAPLSHPRSGDSLMEEHDRTPVEV